LSVKYFFLRFKLSIKIAAAQQKSSNGGGGTPLSEVDAVAATESTEKEDL
jgi:hypothetical protein